MKIRTQKGFAPLELALILVIVGIIGFAGWFVWHSKQNTDNAYNKAASVNTATKNAAKKSTTTKSASPSTADTTIPAALKENAAAAIDSENTAALEGYMTSSVTVVIAASEKGGAETAAQAVTDLDYVKDGTSPWDFSLDAATLTSYKNGSYGKYFGANTIVGKSANNYVISFGVTGGKIDTVFMTNMASVLTD